LKDTYKRITPTSYLKSKSNQADCFLVNQKQEQNCLLVSQTIMLKPLRFCYKALH